MKTFRIPAERNIMSMNISDKSFTFLATCCAYVFATCCFHLNTVSVRCIQSYDFEH